MAWTYSGDPAASTRDSVRFLIGDTDTNDQLLNDAEVAYFITTHGTVNRAASEAARAVAAKFARLMNRSIGALSADFSTKYRQYLELAGDLLLKEETEPVSPFVSGWKKDQKEAYMDDSNREPIFGRKGVHDNDRVYPSDDNYDTSYRIR
jgi:hypothetical protein